MITVSFIMALSAFVGVLVLAIIVDNEIKRLK
jgi:hypothetical protein